jgi:transcriptional regulator of met regulon
MKVVDLTLICRLCAKQNEFCVEVFGEDGKKNNILKKITSCLPIAVSFVG